MGNGSDPNSEMILLQQTRTCKCGTMRVFNVGQDGSLFLDGEEAVRISNQRDAGSETKRLRAASSYRRKQKCYLELIRFDVNRSSSQNPPLA